MPLALFVSRERGMKGDKQVIHYLNQQLTNELTAINQYYLHAHAGPLGLRENGQART